MDIKESASKYKSHLKLFNRLLELSAKGLFVLDLALQIADFKVLPEVKCVLISILVSNVSSQSIVLNC